MSMLVRSIKAYLEDESETCVEYDEKNDEFLAMRRTYVSMLTSNAD